MKQTVDQQIAQLEAEMAKAPPEQKQAYANRINYLTAIKKEINAATQQRKTEDTERILDNLQRGGTTPPTAAPASAAATPPVTGPNAPRPGQGPSSMPPGHEGQAARPVGHRNN